jgi:O-antigen/teichoic acid export membrane protein
LGTTVQLVRSFSTSLMLMLRNGRGRAYLHILIVGSGLRVFGLASQFVVLIVLGRLLSKDSFGDLMTAFGFYRAAAVALGIGGSLVLLYHVSRNPKDIELEVRLHRYSAILGALASALVAVVGIVAAEPIAHALSKPDLAGWLRQLAPFAVFNTLLVIATGALEGRSRISDSIALGEVAPNAVRLVLLPLLGWLHLPESYVAHVLTLSVLIPWVWAAQRLWDRSITGVRRWAAWDYGYCGKFVAATLFANQLGAVDILVAGVLFPSEAVADYAVASRIAALFAFLQLAILKRFSPRAGALIHSNDLSALKHEVELCRHLMIGCGALTIATLLLVAPFLLPLFGNYASARTFLVWLAIPPFVQSFYETSDRLLIMAGQPNVPLAITACSFFLLITLPFVLAPWTDMASIPAAMIVSILLLKPIVAGRVRKMFQIRTVHPRDVVLIAVGTAGLAGYAVAGALPVGVIVCSLVAAIGLYYLGSATKGPAGTSVAKEELAT